MNSIELFAGAGGLGMGVARSGFRHAAVLEWDQWACATIKENQARGAKDVAGWPVIQGDVREYDYGDIDVSVDLIAGGPPCQPFSLGGKHRGHLDDRDMFPEAVRAVRELRPRAFIVENVPGLLRQKFTDYFEYIYFSLSYPEVVREPGEEWLDHRARLEEHHTGARGTGLSYQTVFTKLNAADFGVPQRRERVFLVGFRRDLGVDWSFPRPSHSEDALLYDQWVSGDYWDRHEIASAARPECPKRYRRRIDRLAVDGPGKEKPWRTVRDAITDLPDPVEWEDDGSILNHAYNPGARTYPGHTGSPLDAPAKTLKAGDHGVPGGENMVRFVDGSVRYFTVRESARLQCFPDHYIFHGSWSETMRQLGNAVPVDLAERVATSVHGRLARLDAG